MKKTFPLKDPRRADARVLEAVKNELRKYVRREQRKTLPEGFGRWDFACKVGAEAGTARTLPLSEVIAAVDAAAQSGAAAVFVEIVALPAQREPRDGVDV
ncbi:MAG TPA: DUF6172 family protein [Opitutaceae bacterium]|nr:DUF6172 family protein [Opitutaceae bacterium]